MEVSVLNQTSIAPTWQDCAGCGEPAAERDPDRPEMCLACSQPEPEEHR